MENRNKKKKSGAKKVLITAFVVGELAVMASYCLPHAEKEGIMVKPVHSENSVEEETAIVDNSELNYDYTSNTVYMETVYDMITNKGYDVFSFPDFNYEVLDEFTFTKCQNDLGVTTTGLNFRGGPTTDYPVIQELKANTTVDLIARCNENGWYLVQKNGNLGFVSGDYVKEMDSKNIVEQMQQLPELIPVVQATTEVNVRPQPNTDYQEFGKLQLGEYIPMVRLLENGWYEVVYNGQIG